jgi:hypothetical protein
MQKRKRQSWNVGDVFLVKILDKRVVGQIVGHESEVLNSVSCAFFDIRVGDEEEVPKITDLPIDKVFSVIFATRDLLDSGAWRVVNHARVAVPQDRYPFEDLRDVGFIGAIVYGSAIVNEFLNAFYGLMPWDDWKNPDYLDHLLISRDKKPKTLVYKAERQ